MAFHLSIAWVVLALCSFRTVAQSKVTPDTMSSSQTLPTVDLGYNIQRATKYNKAGDFYSFSNIRYAAPPTGESRFRAPQPPAVNRTEVQTGEVERTCHQALAGSMGIVSDPKIKSDASSSNKTSGADESIDAGTTEDCLFLDVAVPKDIFQNAGRQYGAPVMVWIYGGGFTFGDKSSIYDPSGLIARSREGDGEGIVYVALNYRLGAFGFLAGPTFQQDGTANAGLYDQRFALQWVQDNIAKFGGDPNRVTVFGESAGAGSIMYQLTAYGGSERTPFQQALPQSAATFPLVSNHQQEQMFNDYLTRLNVSTISEARNLSSDALQAANAALVGSVTYGGFSFGPTVDGEFVTAMPSELFSRGRFDKSVRVMVGHNADEGRLFVSSSEQNDTTFRNTVTTLLPTIKANPSSIDYITDILYPSSFDGSHGYTNQIDRAIAFVGDTVLYSCGNAISKAYGNSSYAYQFSVPPALHASDVPYTFYSKPSDDVNTTLAITMQTYFTNFAMTGNPNGRGVVDFPMYGDSTTIFNFNVTGNAHITDPTANMRNAWLQQVLYV